MSLSFDVAFVVGETYSVAIDASTFCFKHVRKQIHKVLNNTACCFVQTRYVR